MNEYLTRFCAPESSRNPWLTKPFSLRGYDCASNGPMLVVVAVENPTFAEPEIVSSTRNKIIEWLNQPYSAGPVTLSRPEMSARCGIAKWTSERVCSPCTGQYCGKCHGSGKVIDTPDPVPSQLFSTVFDRNRMAQALECLPDTGPVSIGIGTFRGQVVMRSTGWCVILQDLHKDYAKDYGVATPFLEEVPA